MKTVKVEITAKRPLCPSSIVRVIEVEKQDTAHRSKKLAMLKFCNEYINRDVYISEYNDLTEAKKVAKLKITAKLITQKQQVK